MSTDWLQPSPSPVPQTVTICGSFQGGVLLLEDEPMAPWGLASSPSSSEPFGPVPRRSRAPAALETADDRPLRLALDEWERDLRHRLGREEAEIRKGMATVRRFFADSGARLRTVNRQHVLRWVTWRLSEGGPGVRKTVKNEMSRLRGFARFCMMAGHLRQNPFAEIQLPRAYAGRGAEAMTWEEVGRLIAVAWATHLQSARASERESGLRRAVLYHFLASTGLRISEAMNQRWEDLDLDRRELVVTRDKARRRDAIPIPAECVEVLRSWRTGEGAGALLFPVRVCHKTLQDDLRRAGVPVQGDGARGFWHRFRKAAITGRARAGADYGQLHKFARHQDASLTLRHYDQRRADELREVADLLPPLWPGAAAWKEGGHANR